MGLYDINNENFNEKDFKGGSVEPIIKVKGMMEPESDDDSSSDEGSDDSNLYYEFNSDDEVSSHTTKSTIPIQ